MLVEYAEEPLSVETRKPRFTWEVPLDGRGRRQSAYRILVASSAERLVPGKADLWDSGKVASGPVSEGAIAVRGAERESVIDVGSGTYRFAFPVPVRDRV